MKFKVILVIIVFFSSFSVNAAETKKHYGIAGPELRPQPEVKKEGSYMINGVGYTTRTHNDTKDYAREGTASYYHNSLAGNPTANGEIYHPTKFTAAHKTLPLGSYAVVTNLRNNRKVIVKINDRGPFVKTRIIDLSKIAAQEIGMLNSGVARVKVEALHVDPKGKITGAGTQTLLKSVCTEEGVARIKAGIGNKNTLKKNESPTPYTVRIINIKSKKQADELTQLLMSKEMKQQVKQKNGKFELYLENIATKADVYQLKNKLSKLEKHQLVVYTYNN